MKALIYSDIHLEFGKMRIPHHDYDMVILAGDIAPGKAAFPWIEACWKDAKVRDVVYVAGNHEFYGGRNIEEHYKAMADRARTCGVNFLQNDVHIHGDVRVLGCTLWTDFALDKDQHEGMRYAEACMNDYSQIKGGDGLPLRATKVLWEHKESVVFLRETLAKPFTGKTIVVTHMAPSAKSVRPAYASSRLNHCYASNLDSLIEEFQPDLWVHGHMHSSNDYNIGKTRIISNPRGYVNQFRAGPENKDFKEDFIIEI